MGRPDLTVVAGTRPRGRNDGCGRDARGRDELAARWRASGSATRITPDARDVIPLLDGWVRRLERETGVAAPGGSAKP